MSSTFVIKTFQEIFLKTDAYLQISCYSLNDDIKKNEGISTFSILLIFIKWMMCTIIDLYVILIIFN